MDYTYAYLLFAMLFGLVWLAFWFYRKDLRVEMLTMSVLFGVLSVIVSTLWHNLDWWLPSSILGTRVGLEDFILGFFNGGVVGVIYEVATGRHLRSRAKHKDLHVALIVLASLIVVALAITTFNLTTFMAYNVVLFAVAALIVWRRHDLLMNALVSGALMVVLALPIYWIVELAYPGWLDVIYVLDLLSGVKFIGIPVEDLVFFFFLGMAGGPAYEYWQEAKLEK